MEFENEKISLESKSLQMLLETIDGLKHRLLNSFAFAIDIENSSFITSTNREEIETLDILPNTFSDTLQWMLEENLPFFAKSVDRIYSDNTGGIYVFGCLDSTLFLWKLNNNIQTIMATTLLGKKLNNTIDDGFERMGW